MNTSTNLPGSAEAATTRHIDNVTQAFDNMADKIFQTYEVK